MQSSLVEELYDLLAAEQKKNEKLQEALEDMVAQHCYYKSGLETLLWDNGLSANEDALELLCKLGRVERLSEDKMWYRWTDG